MPWPDRVVPLYKDSAVVEDLPSPPAPCQVQIYQSSSDGLEVTYIYILQQKHITSNTVTCILNHIAVRNNTATYISLPDKEEAQKGHNATPSLSQAENNQQALHII